MAKPDKPPGKPDKTNVWSGAAVLSGMGVLSVMAVLVSTVPPISPTGDHLVDDAGIGVFVDNAGIVLFLDDAGRTLG